MTDQQFEAAMVAIDCELRQESTLISGREVRAWLKFCQRFKMSMGIDDPIADRIFDWYRRLYGERLNLDCDFGDSLVLIRGDAFRLRCFRFYGKVCVVCSAKNRGQPISWIGPEGEIAVVNLLDDPSAFIDGLTAELADRLTDSDCRKILNQYRRAFRALAQMELALVEWFGHSDAPYIREAMDDLRASSEMILLREPNYGQSNWASLQATEKVLKSFILEMGGSPAKTHRLDELCRAAQALGLTTVRRSLVDSIQCSPDVRYNSRAVPQNKALNAYHAALVICAAASKHVTRSTARSGVVGRVHFELPGGSLLDGIILGHSPPVPPFVTQRP